MFRNCNLATCMYLSASLLNCFGFKPESELLNEFFFMYIRQQYSNNTGDELFKFPVYYYICFKKFIQKKKFILSKRLQKKTKTI